LIDSGIRSLTGERESSIFEVMVVCHDFGYAARAM
jgi:hypothetical protein